MQAHLRFRCAHCPAATDGTFLCGSPFCHEKEQVLQSAATARRLGIGGDLELFQLPNHTGGP